MSHVSTIVTWDDVRDRLSSRIPVRAKLWGVPTGGSVVAALSGRMVDTPEAADIIVDDLIDSGATASAYAKYNKPFVGLWDKREPDADLGWIVFPWEHLTAPEDAVARVLQWLGHDTASERWRDAPAEILRTLRAVAAGETPEQ